MTPFTTAKLIAKSPNLLYRDLINEFENGSFKGKTLSGDPTVRLK